jgi:sialic acid synthase SpsE
MPLNLNDDRCFVIAEAGTAHAGIEKDRKRKAMSLVESAARAGVDAVKFQWFHNPNPDTMFCWIDGDEVRAPRWRASYMPTSDWKDVRDFAIGKGIILLASTFEGETVQWLHELDIAATKVASRAAKTFPYYRVDLPRPFIISDGMGLPEIWDARVNFEGTDWLMQCEANYPSTDKWKGANGFSDHSGKPFLGIDAIARGCPVLEVHFHNGETDPGPDKPASLDYLDLALICKARDYYAERKSAA